MSSTGTVTSANTVPPAPPAVIAASDHQELQPARDRRCPLAAMRTRGSAAILGHMQTTQLKTAPFGGTGLEITRVGFGAWAIGGGGWEFGWGPQDDDAAVAAIHR